MCIFSQPVLSVNNTQIFARTTSRRTQFLVYQMSYESSEDNAMILPLPIRQPAHDESLRFVSLQEYETFFEDLEDGFPYTPPTRFACSGSFDKPMANSLAVFEVGNYIASFVPQLKDFSRLDERFTLPASTWSQVPHYAEFGFAVFQLAAGALAPHPMAFEFQCNDDSLYFPTMHIHDGHVHDTERFDHVLYMQHAGFDSQVFSYENSDIADKSTGLVRSKQAAKQFCDIDRTHGVVDGNLLVHRKTIRGQHLNRDTEIKTLGDPVRPTLNMRPWLAYSPWAVFGVAAAWLFGRRSLLKKSKSKS